MFHRTAIVRAALIGVIFTIVPHAGAATHFTEWIGGHGDWEDPARWDNGVPMGFDTEATFDVSSDIDIDINADASVETLRVLDSNLEFDFNGFEFNAGNSAGGPPAIVIDNPGSTTARFINGTVTTYQTLVGNDPASRNSDLWLDQTDWTIEYTGGASVGLVVGGAGEGHVSVFANSSLTVNDRTVVGRDAGASGVMNVQGTFNHLDKLTIGESGEGTFYVGGFGVGGTVDSNGSGDVRIGWGTTGQGSLSIADTGTWTGIDLLTIGHAGEGRVEVTADANAATLEANFARMAFVDDSQGELLVDGSGAMASFSAMSVGNGGAGSTAQITVRNGATLDGGFVTLGESFGADATVDVEAFSTFKATNLIVGGDFETFPTQTVVPGGDAAVNIGPEAMVEVLDSSGPYRLGTHIVGNGIMRINGGTLRTPSMEVDGSDALLDFNFGTIHITGDETVDQEFLQEVIGYQLNENQHLRIDGQVIFTEILDITGGTFSVGTPVLPQFIEFQRGTLNFVGPDGLTVGFGGAMGQVVQLGPEAGEFVEEGFEQYQHLNVADHADGTTNTLHVAIEGLVTIGEMSSIGGENILVDGEVVLAHETAMINGDTLEAFSSDPGRVENHGLIRGTGRINAVLFNEASGKIRVDPAPVAEAGPDDGYYGFGVTSDSSGDGGGVEPEPGRLVLTKTLSNHGQVIVEDGQSLDVLASVINEADGEVHLTGGARVGVQSFENFGNLTMSNGGGDVFGPMYNLGGRISVSEASTGRLYGVLDNQGTVVVNADSTLVVLGDVSGPGDYPGSGQVIFADNFSPGSSPGEVAFGGNLDLTGANQIILELAGLLQGSQYDHLDIAGLLELGGTLNVQLLDGFEPNIGDTFDLIDFGALAGNFDNVLLPALQQGQWDTGSLYSTGSIAVIPEPTTLLLLATGVPLLVARRRH